MTAMSSAANLFDIKSASLDLLALVLRSTNLAALEPVIKQRFAQHDVESYLLDLDQLNPAEHYALHEVCTLLQKNGVRIAAIRHKDPALESIAHKLGLPFVLSGNHSKNPPPVESVPTPVINDVLPASTLIIDRPVRAGQQIYAKGGDLVILEMVSAGAEVIADGSIHVYAPLRGRALAGARGNTSARIFVKSMEAELVSIAGIYRTIEQDLPASIKGKPTQIYLEQERVVMTALDK